MAQAWYSGYLTVEHDKDVKQRFFQGMDGYKSRYMRVLYQDLCNMVSMDTQYIKSVVEGGAMYLESVAEATQKAPTYLPQTGPVAKHSPSLFKAGFDVSREKSDDDTMAYIAKHAKRLGNMAMKTLDRDSTNAFLNTATVLDSVRDWRDGVSLANAAHPCVFKPGTTWANRPGTPTAMSESSLKVGLSYFDTMVDDDGVPMPLGGMKLFLVTPTAKYRDGLQLVSSTGSTQSGLNANVTNPVEGNGQENQIEVITSPFLTSPTAWALVLAPGSLASVTGDTEGLDVLYRDLPKMESPVKRQNPDKVEYVARMRTGYRVSNPRVLYYNDGA